MKYIPKSFRDRYRSRWRTFELEVKTFYGKLQRQFIRPPFPKLENEVVNLHLGCGSINHPKFINIDGLFAPHIHYIRAIDNLSPFRDNSVNLIYACHCLEHIPHAQVAKVLNEWFRVLNKGGLLRLSVPDFDLLLNIYKDNNNDINTILGMLMGAQDYKFNFHMTAFNRTSLKNLLIETGFKKIKEWQPCSCELTTFDDCSARKVLIDGKYYPVSLNLEAVK
ncbi:class I SAM-dependent methyltransferase [Coleofasciculus sp. G2-EDA-02]|uniref:class I SAM-dependent methyltransferase n=1 Tax=Coleofasciculus sp. G2-EDA-02 TaxID=3069529 RepID=UPI0032F73930